MSTAAVRQKAVSAAPSLSIPALTSAVQEYGLRWLSILEAATDLVSATIAVLLSYAIYHQLAIGRQLKYPVHSLVFFGLAVGLLLVALLERDGAYRCGISLLRIKETERVLRASTQACILVLPVTFFAGKLFSRYLLVLAMIVVPLALLASKQFAYQLTHFLFRRGYGVRNAIIYGAGFTGRRVLSALALSSKIGYRPVAMVDDNAELAGKTLFRMSYHRQDGVQVIPGPLTEDMIRECDARVVIVAIPSMPQETFSQVLAQATAAGSQIMFIPGKETDSETIDYIDVDGVLLATFAGPPRRSVYEVAKRCFDFVTTLALLVIFAPLLALVAACVKLGSPGPAIFRQKRVGRDGKEFELYKFRSMSVTAPAYDFSPTVAQDPRITRVGRWLRKTSLDELPQLFNVLKGEMSLVGPRPEMPFITQRYGERHRQRLSVIPGITGLWQISADRAFLIHENVQYDIYYIKNRGFFMDLAILLHTAAFAMRGV